MFQDVSFLGFCPLAGARRQTVEYFLVDHAILGGLKPLQEQLVCEGSVGRCRSLAPYQFRKTFSPKREIFVTIREKETYL
jgi:hypothetical protein